MFQFVIKVVEKKALDFVFRASKLKINQLVCTWCYSFNDVINQLAFIALYC